jgi:4-hydroxy-3-methylbut-2-enyl diphosphate reductase
MVSRIVLASPRGFCAGVERAVGIVERCLARYPPPLYVRRQIVHNTHVVADFARRGVRFVQDLSEVPPGSRVVFSAHGVTPAVREEARNLGLQVIDATCPLVMKVHEEARRFHHQGFMVVLIGHRGHDEVIGTMGEAPMHLVQSLADIDALPEHPTVACLTQTTLSVEETTLLLGALRKRFPGLVTPLSGDICYATTNRQAAVRALAKEAALIFVLGSSNSSNSRRLVETAEAAGAQAVLIDGIGGLDFSLLEGIDVVGITSGASAPEHVMQQLVQELRRLFPRATVEERITATERMVFPFPRDLLSPGKEKT